MEQKLQLQTNYIYLFAAIYQFIYLIFSFVVSARISSLRVVSLFLGYLFLSLHFYLQFKLWNLHHSSFAKISNSPHITEFRLYEIYLVGESAPELHV